MKMDRHEMERKAMAGQLDSSHTVDFFIILKDQDQF
jgi:hypothetical protein